LVEGDETGDGEVGGDIVEVSRGDITAAMFAGLSW
jgi:hypothetical protein